MKILVTGATGFIGQHVVIWLVQNRKHDEIITSSTSLEKAKKKVWFDKTKYIPCNYFTDDLNYY